MSPCKVVVEPRHIVTSCMQDGNRKQGLRSTLKIHAVRECEEYIPTINGQTKMERSSVMIPPVPTRLLFDTNALTYQPGLYRNAHVYARLLLDCCRYGRERIHIFEIPFPVRECKSLNPLAFAFQISVFPQGRYDCLYEPDLHNNSNNSRNYTCRV